MGVPYPIFLAKIVILTYITNNLAVFLSISCKFRVFSLFLTSAMHHPKTLIGQELLHQTIVNYKKFF